MNSLKNLALLSDFSNISNQSRIKLKQQYKNEITKVKNRAYINRDAIPLEFRSKITNLDEYLPLSVFSDLTGIRTMDIHKRIDFMRRNNTKIFEFLDFHNITYLKVGFEMIELLNTHNAYLVTYCDNTFQHLRMFGDFKIGFWE